MKKVLLFSLIALSGNVAMAQRNAAKTSKPVATVSANAFSTANKSTGNGDSYTLTNIISYDSLTYYSYNSNAGFVEGMNTYGDKGYAERYDFSGADSSMVVTGMVGLFHGTYTAATTKTINVKVWSQGAKTQVSTGRYNDGLPGTVLATQTYSITNLGIDPTQSGLDSGFVATFTTPTSYLSDSFYVGYDMTYTATALGGDTIGVYSTTDGSRTSAVGYLSGTDTIFNVQNAVQLSTGTWIDEYSQNIGLYHDYALFPMVTIKYTTGIKGIDRNNFTLYGSYPNPATTATNVRFALKTADDVTISLMDMSGRTISTTTEKSLGAGEHTSAINTATLAAGNYIYLVRTGSGAGIASQFTVVR